MATNINTILGWFTTGKKPTQTQFWDSWQSFWHKDEAIPQNSIINLISTLDAKTDKALLDIHLNDLNAHTDALEKKLDKGGYNGTGKDLNDRISSIEMPDRVLKFGEITLTGLNLSIAKNAFAWVLNKTEFLDSQSYTTIIKTANTGMYRNDILVGNENGDYQIVEGVEAETGEAAAEPAVPSGTIKLGFISVFGTSIKESGNLPSIEKITIVDEDRIIVDDSASSFSKKAIRFSNIKTTLKSYFDSFYKSWFLGINLQTGNTYTFAFDDYKKRTIFTNVTPLSITIPTNAAEPIPIGAKIEYTQKGEGIVNLVTTGITLVTNLSLAMLKGETRTLTKIDINTWSLEGNKNNLSEFVDNIGLSEIKMHRTFFVSNSGNDSTARIGSSNYPYKTVQAALLAMSSNFGTYGSASCKVVIMDSATYTIASSICYQGGIDLSYLNIESNNPASGTPKIIFKEPINVNVGFWRNFNIEFEQFTISNNWNGVRLYPVNSQSEIVGINILVKGSNTILPCHFALMGSFNRIQISSFEIAATASCSVLTFNNGFHKEISLGILKTSQTITHPSYSGGIIGLPAGCDFKIGTIINNTNTTQNIFNRWTSVTNTNIIISNIACPISGGFIALPVLESGAYVQGASINYIFNDANVENTYFINTTNYGNYLNISGKLKLKYSVANIRFIDIDRNKKTTDLRDNFVLKDLILDIVYPSNPSVSVIRFSGIETSTEKLKLIIQNSKIRTSHPTNIFRFDSNIIPSSKHILEFRDSNYFDCQKELIDSAITPIESQFIISRKSSIINVSGLLSSNENISILEI